MKTILVADDEPHMRQLLKFCLGRLGARLLLVGSGEDVLRTLETDKADVLVIDVGMPGMDGFATVKALREREAGRGLPVVMLTARGLADVKSQADEIGVAAFFTKPFSPTELADTVKRLLG